MTESTEPDTSVLYEARLWRDSLWTARVIKNEDDGWAVEMTRQGDPEPALVGPWTMGRDKKNPSATLTAHDDAADTELASFPADDGERPGLDHLGLHLSALSR